MQLRLLEVPEELKDDYPDRIFRNEPQDSDYPSGAITLAVSRQIFEGWGEPVEVSVEIEVPKGD